MSLFFLSQCILTRPTGKQHDVAECMDNCMFQIETALLKFDGLGSADDKGSIVKRLHKKSYSIFLLLKVI